ncbi:MAG: PAC2 family protein [Proteobacteria bacterium]|nr:PAC2 family protein [Pseudomonadota bacterium]
MSRALRMHVAPELHDPPLVLAFDGWNDAGEAATNAVRYVAEAIHTVPLADIDPEEFYDFTVRRPEVVLVNGRREIQWPQNEFRYGSVDGDRELVTGVGVEPHLRWRHYVDAVAELVRSVGVRRVVLLGAYLAEVVYSRPVAVTGFATRSDELERLGVEPSAYQGPTGVLGVLADRLDRDGVDVVSLWAGLPHYINASPNPRGALALVQKLTQCLDFRIDDEPLRKEAAEFEQRISALVTGDPELADYVRQLKRRDFAQ